MDSRPASWVIQGETVTVPVEVRDASMATATFLVPAEPARRLVAPTGLRLLTVARRAVLALVFVDYRDTDLGPYHEVGVSLLVRPPGGGKVGAYIHQLPVDQAFTLEAGRDIWGFPKWMTRSEVAFGERHATCHLTEDGDHILSASIQAPRFGRAMSRTIVMDAWTHRDGVLRRTPWTMQNHRMRMRLGGGASVVLGASHPMARELADLGLPRRAVLSSIVGWAAASFGSPEVVG